MYYAVGAGNTDLCHKWFDIAYRQSHVRDNLLSGSHASSPL